MLEKMNEWTRKSVQESDGNGKRRGNSERRDERTRKWKVGDGGVRERREVRRSPNQKCEVTYPKA